VETVENRTKKSGRFLCSTRFCSKAERLCQTCGLNAKLAWCREDGWIKVGTISLFNKFSSKAERLCQTCGLNAKLAWCRRDRWMKLWWIFHFDKISLEDWTSSPSLWLGRETCRTPGSFLFFLTLTLRLRRALAVSVLDDTSCFAARSVQETRPDFPSGTSLALPFYKDKDEIDILFLCIVLQTLPTRTAGGESKSFCFLSCRDGRPQQRQF